MEKNIKHFNDHRISSIQNWLTHDLHLNTIDFSVASSDASFRRYFRITTKNENYIIMDAPPDKEPLDQFIKVATLLHKLGLNAPVIHHIDQEKGFMLLEDFGRHSFLSAVSNPHYNNEKKNNGYLLAIQQLITLQSHNVDHTLDDLPIYNHALIQQELDLFTQWYLKKSLNYDFNENENNIWQQLCATLTDVFSQQPQTYVHRDYHSRNLMLTEKDTLGIIDFQDMVIGPICYDLVSLCKDCYIEWSRDKQIEWLTFYFEKIKNTHFNKHIDFTQFIYWYDLTGLQRHLKVLGIFSRLNLRDNKPQYLKNIPLVEKYILEVLDIYPELSKFETVFTSLLEKQ